MSGRSVKKKFQLAVFSAFFLLILGYAFFTSKNLLFGVKITDVNLADGATIPQSTINLTGNAKNAVWLSLNGREISIDKEGNFGETIALLPGYNVVSISSRDKFGNVDEENYKLIH